MRKRKRWRPPFPLRPAPKPVRLEAQLKRLGVPPELNPARRNKHREG
jgi:hypothetical protein